MKTKHFHKFSNLMKFLSDRPTNHSQLFRGQKDSKWALETRWCRFRRDCVRTGVDTKNLRKQLNQQYRRELSKLGIRPSDFNETQLETFGQHHGLPTRLMDWSYSPYTALFFALAADEADAKATGRCAIFEIDVVAFCFAMSFMLHKDEAAAKADSARDDAFAHSLGFDNPRILEFEHTENKRMNRQSGVFIFLNESIDDLVSYEQKCISQHPDCEFLSKYTLSNSKRQKGIGQLYLMGHTSSDIYVDETRATFDATNFILTNM